ncbi:MAG TPA: hypothetical protein VLS45_02295 [Methylomicrobium sp.]|nr:hypothetical protein [Methylomicrobium sp.]
MELRIDIDQIEQSCHVCRCISWDLTEFYDSGEEACANKISCSSWVIRSPEILTGAAATEIYGTASGLGTSAEIQACIKIIRNDSILIADVALSGENNIDRYQCSWHSSFFHDADLQIDVCKNVAFEPVLPEYQISGDKVLTLESVYAEAGICLSVSRQGLVSTRRRPWLPDGLHLAMHQHFHSLSESPQWQLWGLVANRFHQSDTAGIMFSQAESRTSLPAQRGFAVFREHESFAGLKPGSEGLEREEAAKRYLHTFVHEIGHAFNLQHSWEKGRPDALSWMNTAGRYDKRNGKGSFWRDFEFQFDHEEIVKLRHGWLDAAI